MALIALVGWNALAADHARVKKISTSGEVELSQLGDDVQTPGRIPHPQVSLAYHPTVGTRALVVSSRLVLIEKRGGPPVFLCREGAIRGRAPPAGPVA